MDIFLVIHSDSFQHYFNLYGYAGIYLYFITADQISPIPEEVSLIVAGYLAALGYLNPFIAGAVSIAGFITIDTIYFYLTISGNKLFLKMTHRAQTSQGSKYGERLQKHMLLTLIGLSFIPRVRLFAPIYVALAKQTFAKFILYSAISLSLFTAVYISLGFVFHQSLSTLLAKTQTTGHIIFIVSMVVLSVGMSIFAYRKLKE